MRASSAANTIPRSGLKGVLDRFVGPGATPAELVLQFSFPIIAAFGAVMYTHYATSGWSSWQYIICGLLAFDVVGVSLQTQLLLEGDGIIGLDSIGRTISVLLRSIFFT